MLSQRLLQPKKRTRRHFGPIFDINIGEVTTENHTVGLGFLDNMEHIDTFPVLLSKNTGSDMTKK